MATSRATGTAGATTTFTDARLVDATGERRGWLRLRGDRIETVGQGAAPAPTPRAGDGGGSDAAGADVVVDCGGAYLTPGFIDIHSHGGGGVSAEDGADALAAALAVHRAHGTTRMVLSAVSAPIPELARTLAGLADLTERDQLVLGSHAEGPFLAHGRKGAHDPAALRAPTPADVDALVEAARGTMRQVTLAPELPGGLDAVRRFVAAGVRVAVGHTEVDYAGARAAFDAGATLLTHAFNAMSPLLHRAPGPVAAALEDPRVTLELVLDGVHVHPAAALVLLRAAPGRVALITDAMAATGMGDGSYRLGALDVEVRDGVALVAGTETIAGSTLTLDVALRGAVADGLSLVEAVTALTSAPADALGEGSWLGRLAPGHAGDLVLLDDALTVTQVWAAGRHLD
ncbi:MAG: N-acetylglucosamine-6-phosphate deacetylase [Micrococcales bacterium 73-15]|uniref:N-acetylglucosamine-6-phosphate deacetylase n=1 Tax=Salana multivorans TaxID=120377 RepID=UPI00095C44BE|nr:N-acetylglucosamine-6-phosphate deacetylase [Salana multivorans]OJX98233.1 MAG: N-acetylglucosamine-6-phosphate deacetylase [Micrococcales bacterium 73-15]